MKNEIEEAFPNIARWVNEYDGFIEIGYDYNTSSFVRALNEGGLLWAGEASYETLDEAFSALENGIAKAMKEIYGKIETT